MAAPALDCAAFDADLPLAWSVEAGLPPARAQAENRLLLTVLGAPPAGGHTDPALARLEAKLDLDLYLNLGARAGALPPPCPARVGLDAVAFAGTSLPAPGTAVWLALAPEAMLPLLLHLPVTVDTVQDGWAVARLNADALDEAGREAWETYVFRRHRESLTAARG